MTAASAVAEGMDDSFGRLAPGVGSAGSLEGMESIASRAKTQKGATPSSRKFYILVIAPDQNEVRVKRIQSCADSPNPSIARWRCVGVARPAWCSDHSCRICGGQLAGSWTAVGSRGLFSTR